MARIYSTRNIKTNRFVRTVLARSLIRSELSREGANPNQVEQAEPFTLCRADPKPLQKGAWNRPVGHVGATCTPRVGTWLG